MDPLGMDTAAVRMLCQQLTAQADHINTTISSLTDALKNTPWVGPGRDRFVAEWETAHAAQLTRVVNALHDAVRMATLNAQQQEVASRR